MSSITVTRETNVALLTLDVPDAPVNTLSLALADELRVVFDTLERDSSINAAVLISGKSDNFIAGADIEQFLEFKTAEEAEQTSYTGQKMLSRLERLRVPVVAAIHGACLGGGLETVLACAWRVATEHPKTVLGLPEVQLGLIPGTGGTQRLPRLVGLPDALDMILRGRNVRPKKALKMGLVDDVVHPAILRAVAVQRASEIAAGTKRRSTGRVDRGAEGLFIERNKLGRSLVFKKARQSVMQQTHGQYPAPLAALDVVRLGYEQGEEAGFKEESRRFGQLAMTEVSRQLIFLFFATNSLKKDPGVAAPVPAAHHVDKLGVLGAGFMGAGIASVAVQQGTLVRLKDTDSARVGKGLAAVREVVRERYTKRQITRQQLDDMMALTGATTEYTGFGNVDLVIEAVFEDLDLKHRVLHEVEPLMPDDAIYASNTSTIPISRIAEASMRPEQVLGMHFFSPVPKMPLLEVIATPRTTKEATVTAVAYGKQLGKTVIVVNDGPGFYTTRTLSAYMNEAGRLLDEGAAIESIDKALVDFGFPVGPITLLDEVGIDVGGKVGLVLSEALGIRMTPSEAMRRVVTAGRLGRKGRSGFYKYDESGKKGDVDNSIYQIIGAGARANAERHVNIPAEEMVRRCVLAMVNEAALCLQEGILRNVRDGDVGAVFGIGFPPFRGGPFRYVDTLGAATVVRQLQELNNRYSPRFLAADVLVEMAKTGRTFYPTEGRPVA
ncbi:MAG TPA: fatty acid oxidation complex subunit alpha FadJ [Gemmatimonadaceae bacterium]|jgi:3-hydroxyacyl-CoA dehydrogenase/enoyl-CoA hydratase/3-hydroxybutyryl-CoA epimerase|nr:fatty acid oxidation complex subunit alpha FadJ [Gemmatimonadaceae bacterium]